MEKFLKNIENAEKSIKTVDHMIYVTFPLIKDKRILLKVIQEMQNAITNCIKSILQYEFVFKNIKLYKDPKSNFRTFIKKCAPKYNIQKEDVKKIFELFDIVEKHKQSPFEFIREEKIVILSEELKPKTLTIEKTKEFLILAKEILRKTKQRIHQ